MHIAITVIFFAVVIFIKLKMPMWKGKYSEKLVNNKIQEFIAVRRKFAKTAIIN